MTDGRIDLEVFTELRNATGDEFAAELVTAFLEEAPGMITELKRSAENGDAEGYRRAAHSLKSNANTFGAAALADLARDVELGDPPKNGDLKDVKLLEAALADAANALRGLIHD